jgi:hypothetical protein
LAFLSDNSGKYCRSLKLNFRLFLFSLTMYFLTRFSRPITRYQSATL